MKVTVYSVDGTTADAVLSALVEQVARDKLTSYWSERWQAGEADEIAAWLLSLIDSDWSEVCLGSTEDPPAKEGGAA